MLDSIESEKDFNTSLREFVINLILFLFLNCFSYILILIYREKIVFHESDYEDAVAFRVSFWICNFSLATSIGAALLLPISVISNEVVLCYPDSYYINWLNDSLIHGFWQWVFLFSNSALFVFLPFAFFFTESQGFYKSHAGIRARVYETFSVLALLAFLTLGLLYILSAIFDYKKFSLLSGFNIWNYFLPFLYSCVSFVGALLLLSCTPVGFAHLFTVVGDLVMKAKFSRSFIKLPGQKNSLCDRNGFTTEIYRNDLSRLTKIRLNLGYPVAMLFLLALTVVSVLLVSMNVLALCFGIKSLPIYSDFQTQTLGISSLSAIGPLGALFDIIIILYLWCSSVVGLYSLPFFCHLRPKLHSTSMTHIIGNSAVLMVLSSALPVLARTLGITNFDLLGDFGKINWLGNFYIVLFYNIGFAVATLVCLGTKITASLRNELTRRILALTKFAQGNPEEASRNSCTLLVSIKED